MFDLKDHATCVLLFFALGSAVLFGSFVASPVAANSALQSCGVPTISLGVPSVKGLTVIVNGVTLPGSSGCSIAYISWNWGDGSPTSNNWFPATHTYGAEGLYTITVTTHQSDGGTASASTAVNLVGPQTIGNPNSTSPALTGLLSGEFPSITVDTGTYALGIVIVIGIAEAFMVLKRRRITLKGRVNVLNHAGNSKPVLLSYSPVIIGAKIARIILGLVALFVIVSFLFSLYSNPASFTDIWQGVVISLIVILILNWLVGKAEYGWEKHQEGREQRLKGLIDTYGKISLKDLSTRLGISVPQTEDLITRMRAADKINARIENGNAISGSAGTSGVGRYCTNCGKSLALVNGRWWCENCKIAAAEETTGVKEVIKEREVVMFACKHCGGRNLQTSTFCSNCGAPL